MLVVWKPVRGFRREFQAGLLTHGSTSFRPFPHEQFEIVIKVQWYLAKFVPVYSDGLVPDSHRIPY